MKKSFLHRMGLFKKRDKRKDGGAGRKNGRDDGSSQQFATSGSYGAGGGASGPRGGGQSWHPLAPASGRPARGLVALPDRVLERIFALVCPHTQDESYESCEDSSIEDACMLCDLRDLSYCVKVCRRWRLPASRVLYHSIRLETVHYCAREAYLADRRKRHSFFDKNGDPTEPTEARLRFLCRTLREDAVRLGRQVQFLKTPYMLRESRQADLARSIAVLPNLRYVDLPEGLFMDDPSTVTLKLEVQARCHDLRKMTYMHGAERSFKALAEGKIWRNLEVLELVKMDVDPNMLRHALAMLGNLRALKVTETKGGPHCFTDDILVYTDNQFPEIPPLVELILTNVPGVTAEGLQDYLTRPVAPPALKVLTLNGTGVKPWNLQDILSSATGLRHLTLVDEVKSTLPAAAGTTDILPLASHSLETLNYEITGEASSGSYSGVTRSYYNYLSGSLMSGGLPRLRTVYVRDADFPDSLLGLPPPMPGFADAVFAHRPSSSHSHKGGPSPVGRTAPPKGGYVTTHHSPGYQASGPPPSSSGNPFQDHHHHQAPPQKPRRRPSKPPQTVPWAAGANPRFSTNNPFAALISPQQVQTLEVFTKGDDDMDWNSVMVRPDAGGPFGPFGGGPGGGGGAGGSRPVSSYGLAADSGGAGGARRSIFMHSGTGHFLAVPDPLQAGGAGQHQRNGSAGQRRRPSAADGSGGGGEDEWPLPQSSGGKKRERMDLWR